MHGDGDNDMIQLNEPLTHAVRRAAAIAVLAVALLPLLVACSASVPDDALAPPASAEMVVPFTRLQDPGGCTIEQITTADHDEYQVLSASADGQWLLMGARLEGAGDETVHRVHELNLATGETTDLSNALQNSGPYSPDGRFIVVAQDAANGKTDIVEYERATGKLTPVASHDDWDWLPSYSPDGRYIVFNSYRVDGQSDIHLFDKSTGDLRRLTDDPRYEAHALFSGDGKRILYHRQQGTREEGGYVFDLFVHDIDTGQARQLTDGNHEDSYAAWAPDGRHIVFSSDVDGKPGKLNLYVLAPDGEITARLTSGDFKDSYAFWSRDGRFIYFNSDRAGATNIYRMPMDGVECVRDGV